MKKIIIFLIFLSGEVGFSQQESLTMFCSIQTMFINQSIKTNTRPDSTGKTTETTQESNSFSLHQMDIILSRAFLDKFNAFVDLEFTLNYSTQNNWGNFNVQEAWFNYKHNDLLNLKVGWLFPEFNNLNAIKNRLILLPYIIRPIVYEQMYSSLSYVKEYIPEHAYFQLSGTYDIKHIRLDYAAYLGNSDNSFISTKSSTSQTPGPNSSSTPSGSSITSGLDTKNFNAKLKGLRIGVRTSDETLKLGFSFTSDKTKSYDTIRTDKQIILTPEETPRWRYGADLRLMLWNFEFETEFIRVTYDFSNTSATKDMSINFLYVDLLYNITDKLYVFTGYQYRENKYVSDKEQSKFFGAGYKLNENIVAKMQYSTNKLDQKQVVGVNASNHLPTYMAAAVSVYF
jgi:hypothetical protein